MGEFVIDDLPSQPVRHRTRWLVLGFVMVVGLAGFGIPGSDRLPKTCAICRLDRVDSTRLWIGWSVEEATDCSEWYAANVEPAHAHVWARRGRCRRFGFAGLGGFSCSWGDPISHLSESRQIEIYQHFEDRLEAKELFVGIGQEGPDADEKLTALRSWGEADYPGTWPDWWEKHRGDAN